MDKTYQIILNIVPLTVPKIIVEATDGFRYEADLSEFNTVCCFPKLQNEWEDVSITASGFNLTWGTRFEVHIDQLIDCAIKKEEIKLTALG